MDYEKNQADFSIWVDADACPREVRDMLIRAAVRRRIPAVFVANSHMTFPDLEYVTFRLVSGDFNAADDYIADHAGRRDLAVTGDIPLASRLIDKGVLVLNPRGEEWTSANIGERLATRNLMEELRAAGIMTRGPKEFDRSDLQLFANALDRTLTRRLNQAAG
ncbi:MAG: YaiI/YqxD family protein [Planctomycetes bacterium]|nr:YaiI/YqxD family protein [Planctomycetota bacterium]